MRNRNDAPRTAQEFQATSARARAQAKERELEAARAKRLGTGKAKPKLPPGRAMLRGLEAFVRYRFRGPRISERDGERIMDVLLCFWASLARELDKPPGWARAWACMIVPVLADARDDAWWLARERQASRRRKGNGWKPDASAKHWGIREHQLDECFGPNKRRRCGLVSIDRPPEVRAEEKRERDRARKRAKAKRPRAVYEAESASRLKPWKAFGIERRAWERRGKPAPPQAEATTQVGSVATPEREYATNLRRPRPTAAKEGLSSREAVSPVTGSPPPPEQTVERVEPKPEPRHNLGPKRRAGTTSARGKLAA